MASPSVRNEIGTSLLQSADPYAAILRKHKAEEEFNSENQPINLLRDARTQIAGIINGVTTEAPDGTSVTRRGNPFIDALAYMTAKDPFRDSNEKGKTIISFAFGNANWYSLVPDGSTLNGIRSIAWSATHGPGGKITLMNGDVVQLGPYKGEQAAIVLAQQLWENVANIDFKDIGSGNILKADLKYIVTNNAAMQGYWKGEAYWDYPFSETPSDKGPKFKEGFTVLNSEYENFSNNTLGAGSLGLYDTVHEIGHQLGLDHPWKESDYEPYFPGAKSEDDHGSNGLNQGIYSVMSYSYGWSQSYRGGDNMPPPDFGSAIGPMAFDIAAIQAIYGQNDKYHSGDNTYKLPLKNIPGVGWMCIWDVGGIDAIDASLATTACVIDLRAATLNRSDGAGAGGYVSWVKGVMGGFTIAHGVIIEKAYGGTSNDVINGNEVDNFLFGNDGKDTIHGFGGWDYIDGGDGDDVIYGDAGADYLLGGKGKDLFVYNALEDFAAKLGSTETWDVIADFVSGQDVIDFRPLEVTLGGKFFFSDKGRLSGKIGEIAFQTRRDTGYGFLLGDLNGDGKEDFKIQINTEKFLERDIRL